MSSWRKRYMPEGRINILYFSSFGSLKWGGQKSLYYLLTNLDKTVFRPCVVLPTDEDFARKLREQHIDVVIQKLPKILSIDFISGIKAVYHLLKLIKKYRIDLIHTDGPRNTFYAGLAARLKRIPLVWHIRASNRDRFDRILTFFPSKIILVADSLRKRFIGITCTGKFVTIHNGVNLAEFKKVGPSGNVKSWLGIAEEGALLIAVFARVDSFKGQKYLIEACGRILSGLPKFHILFAGEIVQQDYQRQCLELAETLNIQERIIFTGHRTEINDMLNETDIVVLPSISGEAFSRAVIEAMAAGKVVITTDVGGASEAVEEGITGFVVPPGDSEALAEKILLLARDRDMRLKMGEAGRIRAEKLFSIEENVRKTEQAYHELLGR
jgi:glycosyltransferase involved in cell wall biosynthesis